MSVATTAPQQRLLRHGLTSLALLFVALAIVGGVRGYSVVPFWDMWDGYLPFLDEVASNGWQAWWRQHNEHRIVLSRLFFWADLSWFSGTGWFLIVVNYLLVAAGSVLFYRMLREATATSQRTLEKHALAAFLVVCLFFWSQHENLTWGFQSQFILAQLLPLTALYVLYRSVQGGTGLFALACLLGVLCIGTMANGILALPLMAAYAILTRQGVRRISVLVILAAVVVFAYFHAFVSPGGHGSVTLTLREHPGRVFRYVFMYLGGPFNLAMGERGLGKVMAQLAGLFFLACSARFAWLQLRQSRHASVQLVLLSFIAYIVGTALGTAGGRALFGLDQALSHRYTTPALMAWAALAILYAPALLALPAQRRRWTWGGLAVLTLLMLVYQVKALQSHEDEMYERAVAALAIEMRVKDQAQIGHVFPTTDVIAVAEQPADKGRSVFGLFPYRGVRAQMGTVFEPVALPACQGALDTAVVIEGDSRFLRVIGWLYDPANVTVPQAVRILGADGKQFGYAMTGKQRDDVAAAISPAARRAGYQGYLLATPAGTELSLRGEGPGGPVCQLKLQTPT